MLHVPVSAHPQHPIFQKGGPDELALMCAWLCYSTNICKVHLKQSAN